MENINRKSNQVAAELRQEIEKLQSVGNAKMIKELKRLKKILNFA